MRRAEFRALLLGRGIPWSLVRGVSLPDGPHSEGVWFLLWEHELNHLARARPVPWNEPTDLAINGIRKEEKA